MDKCHGTRKFERRHTRAQRALWPFPVLVRECLFRQSKSRDVFSTSGAHRHGSVDAIVVEAWLHVCSSGDSMFAKSL